MKRTLLKKPYAFTRRILIQRALLRRLFIVRALFLLITLSISANRASASHAMGTDLTYRCLGGNTYEISLSFYRDCIGIPAPNNPVVSINSASCGQNLTLMLSAIAGTGKEVTPKCSSTVTTCAGGTFTGIQEWVYKGIITLPMQCTDWTFSFSLCCRNAAITTISNPNTSTIWVYAKLNNTIAPGNNSPIFKNKPVPFVCVGQPYCFNHGATDSDGDSIAYKLIAPHQTATSTVNYIGGHSAKQPLTSNPPVFFDTINGEVCMTPQMLEVTVMAVLVEEYRNGVLIGSVERDMQITVMNCNNNLPWLSGINGTNVFNMTVCANVPFCFTILSNDIDTGQTLSISWDSGIPGGSFTSAGNPHPTGTFCWTPADSDVRNNPYCFTVTVKDNACPYYGSQVFSYCITVKGIDVDLGPDQQISCSDWATINATVHSPDPFTYTWSTGATTSYITTGVGTYWCTVANGSCTATDTVVVTSPFVPDANFIRTIPDCLNDTVKFTDQSTSFGSTIIEWTWNFGDGSPVSNAQNPIHVYPGPGTYVVELLVLNSLGCVDSLLDTIAILPPPDAVFTWTNACQGQAVTFTDQSTGGAVTWNWNFGDGQSSASQNPSHIYTSPGSYNVILIAKNSIGCPDTVSHSVTVYADPAANFTTSPVCIGSSTTFTNTSTGGTTSWHWDFGDGGSSTNQNPNHTYAGSGGYNVTLVVTTGNGCTDSITKSVTVNPLPVANAGADITICSGSNGTLVASGGVTYSWSPGGGTNNTITVNPTVNTNYTVTVTDANGCSANDTVSVKVNPLPVANAGADTAICKGASATLTASGGNTYLWSPTGSTTNIITVNPTITTFYNVTVTDTNGCSSSDQVSVIIHDPPAINLNNAFLCGGDTVTLDAGIAGVTYAWSTGDSTQTIDVSVTATYTVTVTDGFGCSSTAQAVVSNGGSVIANPVITALCQGQTAMIDAGNPGYTFAWSTGATTQTITVNAGGTYSVTITSPGGCSSTTVDTVNEFPSPVAGFIAPSNCFGNPISFTDQSSFSSGSILSWNWSFGDGQTSGQQNPINNYAAPGTYNVTLQVGGDNGCVTPLTQSITIYPQPAAGFSATAVCDGDTSFFNNSSNVSSGTITSWNWTFGDGQTSASQNPKHKYTTPGNYNATLIVSTNDGCKDTVSSQVDINDVPNAIFTVPDVCFGIPTAFNNTSNIANGSMASYSWDFGDGGTASSQQPSHAYAAPGNYTVTLTTTSAQGCAKSSVSTTNVLAKPAASFVSENACQGRVVNFTDQSTSQGGNITTRNWDFDDGTSSATTSPIHLYPATGTYNVQLIITSANGCKDTATNPADIYAQPVADFTFTNVCQNSQSTFNNLSSISSGNIISYFWTFGDGSNSLSANPQHLYSAVNTYNVVLIAASDHGCIDTISHVANVFPLPDVDFAGIDACLANAAQFTNLTTVSDGSGFSSSWNFGDTGTSTLTNPSHTFGSGGAHNVTLTATSVNGCTASLTKPVIAYIPPTASFVANNNCFSTPSVLDDNSQSASGNIVNWEWDFGDGILGNGKKVTHTYSVFGQFNVSLKVTTNFGCSALANNPIQIYPLTSPRISAPNVCEGSPVSFVNYGDSLSSIVSSQWTFGDGTTAGSTASVHTYPVAGIYNVTLQTTNQFGCANTALAPVDIYPKPNTEFSTANECLGQPVSFKNNTNIHSGNIASYNWDFGDNSGYSVQVNPKYTYPMEGPYTVTLNAVSDHGCARNMQAPVSVHPLPVVVINGLATGCSPLKASLTDASMINSGNIAGWLWDFGDGDVSTKQHPNHTYTNAGNYTVRLTVSSDKGCTSSTQGSEYMVIHPSSKAEFTMSKIRLDILNPVVEFTNLSRDYTSYSWDFGDGSTSTTILSPSHRYKDIGNYTIVLTTNNSYNCPDIAMRKMDVEPHSTLFAPNAFTPNADGTNDVWKPAYTDLTDIQVWIFNRWGEMLTHWESLDGYWDGVYKGRPVQQDVYVYQIEGTGVDGKLYKWTGDITLVR